MRKNHFVNILAENEKLGPLFYNKQERKEIFFDKVSALFTC